MPSLHADRRAGSVLDGILTAEMVRSNAGLSARAYAQWDGTGRVSDLECTNPMQMGGGGRYLQKDLGDSAQGLLVHRLGCAA